MQENNRTEIATLGEFGLIKHLTEDIKLQNPETIYGVGDDAAVVACAVVHSLNTGQIFACSRY